jgi:transposase-like protein
MRIYYTTWSISGKGHGEGSPEGDRRHALADPTQTMRESTMSSKTNKPGSSKRHFLTPEKKFQIFLETQRGDKPSGEILRREGLYSSDLARIRKQVQEGALERLATKPGKSRDSVSADEYERLKQELEEKERALADLSVELAILRKKTNGGSWER